MSKVIKAVTAVLVIVGAFFINPAFGAMVMAASFSVGISRLIAKRAASGLSGGDGGGRIQLPPATENKIPVIYGTAFTGGPIVDAMLSTDQKTMWYVIALAEHTDTTAGSGYTFDLGTTTPANSKCYYDGKQIQFASPTSSQVTGLITNTSAPQVDTRVNGFLDIYLFTNGSNSGVNTGGQTAQQILSIANGVPAQQAWDANKLMTNCAFAIVKVKYSTDAGTTGVGALLVNITNTITKPGDALLDYMLNTRYGCAIPITSIDTASLTALNTYSDELIDYIPADGNTTPPLPKQERYRVNGALSTGDNCLTNLQILADSCDSWLQYSELTGKWRIVMNKLYDGYPSTSGLFLVDSSNLVGGIDISPIDLNETYNQIEVAYPNTNIKDQTDYQIIDLFTLQPNLLSTNEAVNKLNINLPVVNNAVQAKYLAQRRLYQSREDLVIAFKTDFSGIQVEAGDVIRVTHEVYGWTNKLFRVFNVAEEKDQTGNLFATIQAFEYSDQIYNDVVQDYIPSFNTGLSDPNVIDFPGAPTVTDNPASDGQVKSFDVTSYVPESGLVLYMDFNYGNSSNVQDHRLYRTVQQSNGAPYINSNIAGNIYTNVNVNVNDLPAGNYYWSVTARNNTSGKRSNSSAQFAWVGANLNSNSIPGNTILANSLNGNTIIPNTANGNIIFANSLSGNTVIANTLNGNVLIANTLNGNVFIANTINGNTIQAGTLNGNTIIVGTVNGNSIIAGTITGNEIAANSITANKISVTELSAITANMGTLTSGNILTATAPSTRVEISSTGNFPIWYGSNTKTAANANFYLDTNGNAYFNGVLAANIVTANVIAPGAVTNPAFASNIQPIQIVNTIPVVYSGDVIFYTVDDKLYRWNGTIYTAAVANTDISGNIVANQITNVFANTVFGNFTAANIPNANIIGQLVASQIANVSNTAILGQLIEAQIANAAISSDKLAANSVIAGKIFTNAVTAGTIAANAVTAGTIAANAVVAGTIAANAVLAGAIAANAVVANNIAANAVVAGAIAANAVTAGTIDANAVTAGTIAANAIVTNNIQAGQITAALMAANSIAANNIQANAVVAGAIAANAVTSNTILANAVTANKISVTDLSAVSANMGTLTSGTIQTDSAPNMRVELSSTGTFPIWYGNNTKTAANAKFYLDTSGNAVFAGTLQAAGGTLDIDTTSGNALGILKGSQFVFCRDGVPVTFNPPFPAGTDDRVKVVFIGGGLTYSAALGLSQFQQFEALNITANGFTPSLKLTDIGTGTITNRSVNFDISNTAVKNTVAEAFDDRYYATFDITVTQNGANPFAYIVMSANTGSGNVNIGTSAGYGPGIYSNEVVVGTVDGAGNNTPFYLTVQFNDCFVSFGANVLSWADSTGTGNIISATLTGVPDVVALAYLQ